MENNQSNLNDKQFNSLFCLNVDGYINIYDLKQADYSLKCTINPEHLDTNKSHENFPETWRSTFSYNLGKPIRDYWLDHNPNKLYTLHTNNYITFWSILYPRDKIQIIPNYEINLNLTTEFNRILVDKTNSYLYCFDTTGVEIYKLKDLPPFLLASQYKYNKSNNDLLQNINELSQSENSNQNLVGDNTYNCLFNKDQEDSFDFIVKPNKNDKNDMDYLFSLQKPELTFFDEQLVFQLFDCKKRKYIIIQIDNISWKKRFIESKVYTDMKDTEFAIINESVKAVNYSLAPSLYLKLDDKVGNKQISYSSLENIQFSENYCLSNYYQPLVYLEDNKLVFYDTTYKKVLSSSYLKNQNEVNSENLHIKWLYSNSVLITSEEILFLLIKFSKELNTLGVLISPTKIKELLINKVHK